MNLQPDFGRDNELFPPLPVFKSDTIKRQVFTHRSYYARPNHVFEDHPNDPSPDNEKLEHLGDTILSVCITNLLMEIYPGLRVGPSTKIRAMMIGNPTLAQISLRYKLPDRLRFHPAQAITLRASTNIQADVFEAFVGGLFKDQGLDAVRPWLDALFRPYAVAAYRIARQQHGLPPIPPSFPTITTDITRTIVSSDEASPSSDSSSSSGMDSDGFPHHHHLHTTTPSTSGHLALFNQHIQRTNRQVEWVYSNRFKAPETKDSGNKTSNGNKNNDNNASQAVNGDETKPEYNDMGLPDEVMIAGTHTTPIWYVKVLVDNEYFGRGRGNTKRAARNEAAKEGLQKLGIIVW